jgi:rhodanese-related sulfurtransferase
MTMSPPVLTLDQFVGDAASDRPPVVLDVRDLSESQRGHIPGCALLPRCLIEFRIGTLVADRATPLVVVDGGERGADAGVDPRAELAAQTLVALGYADVAALRGGFAAWRARGLPTLPRAQVASPACGRRVGDLAASPTVDVTTLRRCEAEGRRIALCDVRSLDEHTAGCIPGAVSLPGFEVVCHALDIANEADVIVLCSSAGVRGAVIARTLVDLGVGDACALEGGTLAWRLAGHDLETGSRRRRVRPSRTAQQFARLGAARLAKHFGIERIEASELSALLHAPHGNFHAFDLRDRGKPVVAHVPRSVSVSSDRLIVRHAELIADPVAPVVLIDDDTPNALLTGVWLRRLGVRRVQKLAGGFAGWRQAERPVSSEPETPLGWSEARAATPGLGPEDAVHWLAAHAPARVLHVDSGASYRRGHLPGATWLPRAWLEARIAGVAPGGDEGLLLTCTAGAQAAFAAATLHRMGYAHVAWLQGGTRTWADSGRALESSTPPQAQDEWLPQAEL